MRVRVPPPALTDADMRRVCAYLFADQQGPRRLAEHDSMIARLPGLEWFDLGTRYCLGGAPLRLRAVPPAAFNGWESVAARKC